VSRENVELVRCSFEAFDAEGIEAALPFFSTDVAWYTSDRWLEGSAYRGHEGLRELVAGFTDNFDGLGYEMAD